MTEHDTPNADDSTEDKSVVGRRNRREFMRDTAAVAVAAGALSTGASAQDYEEITVGPGQTWSYSLSDGETFENYLIDISASGAEFQLHATANNWVVRNVGIKGFWDGTEKREPFIVSVPNANATGLVENFYFADGTAADSYPDGPTGIFVSANHAGHIDMVNLNIQDMPDNSVYGSGPGNPWDHPNPGAGGTVAIRDSFSSSPNPAGFRLGTDGSYCENCVMHADGNRGYWGFYEHTELIDCDISNSGNVDIALGDAVWDKSDHAEVTATNTYWETEGAHGGASTANIHGTPANRTPRTSPEEVTGVPLSAEEAASGDGSDGGDSGDPPEYPVIEDFERENPLADYGGETGLFSLTSSPTYEGSSALVNDSGSFGGVNSTSGLSTYPERGDEVHAYFNNASGDNFVAFNLFSQAEADNPDRYSVGLSGVTGDFTLWKTENGSVDTLDSSAPSSTTSGWYRVEVSTDSSTVSADLYDDSSDTLLASVSASDSAFSSGGIGFRSAGNGEVFDYAVFEDEDGPAYDVVEDFERADPLADYGADDHLFDVTSSAYEGEGALINDSGSFGSAVSTSGLDTYPERGDDVEVYFDNASDDNFMAFLLFAQAESNVPDSYMIGISGHGYWRIWRIDNGSLTIIADEELSSSEQISGWYRVEISTDASTISADLYDDASDELISSISASDSTYSSGGIGFRSAGNGEVWDYVIREN